MAAPLRRVSNREFRSKRNKNDAIKMFRFHDQGTIASFCGTPDLPLNSIVGRAQKAKLSPEGERYRYATRSTTYFLNMSLAFLFKKTWHPSTLQNSERVWVAEQKDAAEKKRIEELTKQVREEQQVRELEEMQVRGMGACV